MTDNLFTLDGFRQAADQKYGKLEIDLGDGKVTVLNSPLRISDANRDKVLELVEKLSDEEEDEDKDENASLAELKELVPTFREFLLAVGDDNTPLLLDSIGDDLATLIEIFQTYQSLVGLGEASPSSE